MHPIDEPTDKSSVLTDCPPQYFNEELKKRFDGRSDTSIRIKLLSLLVRPPGSIHNHINIKTLTRQEDQKRYQRIAAYIETLLSENEPEIFLLQEVNEQMLLPYLKQILDKRKWGFYSTDSNEGLFFIFYKYRIRIRKYQFYREEMQQTFQLSLSHLQETILFTLHHVSRSASRFSADINQAYYRELLSTRTEDGEAPTTYLIGSLGLGVAPTNPNLCIDITTEKLSRTERGFTRGGFSFKGGAITPLPFRLFYLSRATQGRPAVKLYTPSAAATVGSNPNYHQTLCIDSKQRIHHFINGMTLATYEEYLTQQCVDEDIRVGLAATYLNQQAIMVRFSDKSLGYVNYLKEYFLSLLQEEGIQFVEKPSQSEDMPASYTFYLCLSKTKLIDAFHQQMLDAISSTKQGLYIAQQLKKTSQAIISNARSHSLGNFQKDGKPKADALVTLSQRIIAQTKSLPDFSKYQQVHKDWENMPITVGDTTTTNGKLIDDPRFIILLPKIPGSPNRPTKTRGHLTKIFSTPNIPTSAATPAPSSPSSPKGILSMLNSAAKYFFHGGTKKVNSVSSAEDRTSEAPHSRESSPTVTTAPGSPLNRRRTQAVNETPQKAPKSGKKPKAARALGF